jgi:hypothetical protein
VLHEKLPGLQDLAVWFPKDPQLSFWDDLCEMLADGSINTLRFLVDDHVEHPKELPGILSYLLDRPVDIRKLMEQYGPRWGSMMTEAINGEMRRMVAESPRFDIQTDHSNTDLLYGSQSSQWGLGAGSVIRFERWK